MFCGNYECIWSPDVTQSRPFSFTVGTPHVFNTFVDLFFAVMMKFSIAVLASLPVYTQSSTQTTASHMISIRGLYVRAQLNQSTGSQLEGIVFPVLEKPMFATPAAEQCLCMNVCHLFLVWQAVTESKGVRALNIAFIRQYHLFYQLPEISKVLWWIVRA